jgi:iron complex outermembrane receptor protein
MSMTNIAPFLLAKIDLFKKLTIKGGLRYENIKVNVDDFNTLSVVKSDGTFTKSIPVEGGKLNYNALVGNIGFRYNIEPILIFLQAFHRPTLSMNWEES